MTDVKAGVEYKINLNGNSFLLDGKKYHLLEAILDSSSLTEAAREINVSYRTALNYIEKIDDTHFNIKYGDKLYDQLIESGLSEDNIYFDPDNTVKDNNYFSNNRSKLLKEREGRNLFGITFDSLPIYENLKQEKVRTRLK